MLTHYLDLVRQFWKLILATAFGTGVLAGALSMILLQVMPVYRSSVTMNMQPSEEALRFNNAFRGVSQFNPATIIAQAHIERLLSRPVAERALDILIAEGADPLAADTPDALQRVKAFLLRTWAVLNYGYYEPAADRDRMVNDLMQATDLKAVAGSYILRLEVSYDDPDLAARAANALSRAYIEVASEDFAREAAAADAALARLQSERQAELARQMERRREADRALGFESVEDGRAILLAARTEARQALAASERQVAALRERIDRTAVADTAALARLRAELHAAEVLVDRGVEALAEAEAGLQALDRTETELLEIDQKIREAETDLDELQTRRIAAELAREARLNQVRVINEAVVPAYPAFPKVLVNTVIGTILGGLLVIAPIAMLDVLDDRVRTAEDLRQAVGSRALRTVSRNLVAQARQFLQTGRPPGRMLEEYAATMGRRFLTQGRQRWPERPVYVTAFGLSEDVARLHAVIEAAVRIVAPQGGDGTVPPRVVALPEMSMLTDWSAYRDGTMVIGVAAGKASSVEVERFGNVTQEAEASPFLTVLT